MDPVYAFLIFCVVVLGMLGYIVTHADSTKPMLKRAQEENRLLLAALNDVRQLALRSADVEPETRSILDVVENYDRDRQERAIEGK